MMNFAINNEAIQGSDPIPLLTTTPYIGDMKSWLKISIAILEEKIKLLFYPVQISIGGLSVEEWRKQAEKERKRINKMGTWPREVYFG